MSGARRRRSPDPVSPAHILRRPAGNRKARSRRPASIEQRRSPLTFVRREAGQIIIQGSENGRALSTIIAEDTGLASSAIAIDGITVTVFGACTPLP